MSPPLKVLVLGDYHLRKTNNVFNEAQPFLIGFEFKWVCSKWATIRSAKKEYFKYKREKGVPHIVIISVGNNDITKVSTEHCVITSLFRTMKLFHKDGVNHVIYVSLAKRQLSIATFNSQVNHVNSVMLMKSLGKDWLTILSINKIGTEGFGYEPNGRDFTIKSHELIATDIKELLNQDKFNQPTVQDTSKFIQGRSGEVSDICHNVGGISLTKERKAVFQNEIQILKLKLNLMVKEKSKTDEHATKLDQSIVSLTQYVSKLEELVNK